MATSRDQWHRGVVVITAAQLNSTQPEIRFCADSNPPPGVSEIRRGEDLWRWCRLEKRLNAIRRSTIPQNNSSSSRTQKCDFSALDRKFPFLENLVRKIRIVSLNWHLVPRLIWICRIQCWWFFFCFWREVSFSCLGGFFKKNQNSLLNLKFRI